MIYKNKYGELWCECGNRIHEYGFFPVDAENILMDSDKITGDEKLFMCDQCGMIVDVDRAEVREEPDGAVARSEPKEQLEVRLTKRGFVAFCGHEVEPVSRFLAVSADRRVPWSYCSACAPRIVKALLESRLSDRQG